MGYQAGAPDQVQRTALARSQNRPLASAKNRFAVGGGGGGLGPSPADGKHRLLTVVSMRLTTPPPRAPTSPGACQRAGTPRASSISGRARGGRRGVAGGARRRADSTARASGPAAQDSTAGEGSTAGHPVSA